MALMAALVPHYIVGIALAAGVFGFFMLCEGFFKVKNDIPPWLSWAYYIAPHSYTFRIFMHNEFDTIDHFDSFQHQDGASVLAFYDMQDISVTADLLVLLAFTVACQVGFGFALFKLHDGKR